MDVQLVATARATSRRQLERGVRVVQAGPYNRVEGLADRARAGDSPSARHGAAFASTRPQSRAPAAASARKRARHRTPPARRSSLGTRGARSASAGGASTSSMPIEDWQLSDLETALAAFVARRDYRDYYQRHGAQRLRHALRRARSQSHRLVRRRTLVVARSPQNPFTIFQRRRPWRAKSARR